MVSKGIIGILLAVVVVVLVAIGLFVEGWMTGYVEPEYDVKLDVTYGLWGFTTSFGGEERSYDYSDDNVKDEEVAKRVATPRTVLIIGIVMAIVFLILAILAFMGRMSGKLAMLIGILAGIILILGALWAVIALKSGLIDDLPEDYGYELGNGLMFYLTLIAAIMAFVSAAMVKGLEKEKVIDPAIAWATDEPAPEGQPPM